MLADVGLDSIALVELLAYTGDYLSYWQDSAATEAYLDTARQRPSVRRHARLLAYAMHDGCNARTWVHFTVDATAGGVSLNVPISSTDPPMRVLTEPAVRLLVAQVIETSPIPVEARDGDPAEQIQLVPLRFVGFEVVPIRVGVDTI